MLTRSIDTPSTRARFARMASMYGASFGRSAITVASTLPTSSPCSRTMVDRSTEQIDARRALPLRIGVGKMPADVAGPRGAENRVGDGVAHGVGVRMSGEAALERNGDAAENQRPPLDQPVQVVANARSAGPAPGLRRRPDRATARPIARQSSCVVILMFDASPSTIRTVWPAFSASDDSSVASSASASASRRTLRRNACGVCARKIVSRSSVASTTQVSLCHERPA